jgi:hypothetical protein
VNISAVARQQSCCHLGNSHGCNRGLLICVTPRGAPSFHKGDYPNAYEASGLCRDCTTRGRCGLAEWGPKASILRACTMRCSIRRMVVQS